MTYNFTGFALSTERTFGLYDSGAGVLIQDRRWETLEEVERFHAGLRPVLQTRLIVVPIRDHVLAEFRDGVRV